MDSMTNLTSPFTRRSHFRALCSATYVFLSLCPTWLVATQAKAQPNVHVRAGTRLTVGVRRGDDALRVIPSIVVELKDDQGVPLGRQAVRLDVEFEDAPKLSKTIITDSAAAGEWMLGEHGSPPIN